MQAAAVSPTHLSRSISLPLSEHKPLAAQCSVPFSSSLHGALLRSATNHAAHSTPAVLDVPHDIDVNDAARLSSASDVTEHAPTGGGDAVSHLSTQSGDQLVDSTGNVTHCTDTLRASRDAVTSADNVTDGRVGEGQAGEDAGCDLTDLPVQQRIKSLSDVHIHLEIIGRYSAH